MAALPTNFKDDILNASMGGKRRYRQISNADNTISLEDATACDQVGSDFGAGQINATNKAVNESFNAKDLLKTKEEVAAVTVAGKGVDALVIKDLNNSLNDGNLDFDFVAGDGLYYNVKVGADTVRKKCSAEPFILPYFLHGTGNKYMWIDNINVKNYNKLTIKNNGGAALVTAVSVLNSGGSIIANGFISNFNIASYNTISIRMQVAGDADWAQSQNSGLITFTP